jgi:putative transposase
MKERADEEGWKQTAPAPHTSAEKSSTTEQQRNRDKQRLVFKLWWAGDRARNFLFAFPPTIRRVIYTTNALESVHARVRKIIKSHTET